MQLDENRIALNSNDLQLIKSVLLAHLFCLLSRHSAVCNVQSLQTVSESKTVRNGFEQVLESLRVNSPVSFVFVSTALHIKIFNIGKVQLISEVEFAVQRNQRIINGQNCNVFG